MPRNDLSAVSSEVASWAVRDIALPGEIAGSETS
jgi:hypothetical protein